jgi:hypothetical protein
MPKPIRIPKDDPHTMNKKAFAVIVEEDLRNPANFVDHTAAHNFKDMVNAENAAATLRKMKKSKGGRKSRRRYTRRRR